VPSAATVIERIKARLTCADLLGVDLAGREKVQVLCPLHDDHNESMSVYANGRCFCFAGCTGTKGFDVVDLYAALHRVPLNKAAAELAQSLGIETRGVWS
jgi:DNA primase